MTSRLTAEEKVAQKDKALCAFCHTPVNRDAALAAPSWQRNGAPPSSVPGEQADQQPSSLTSVPGGRGTYLCLTCHDGTQALDVSLRMDGGVTGSQAHPVGIPYGGTQGVLNRLNSYELARRGFAMPMADVINRKKLWWVDSGSVRVAGQWRQGQPGLREKFDVILFSRSGGVEPSATPYVECASCHDPHQCETKNFLRVDNVGSALCLSCHQGI
jgi:predicted CXXCH cytochrome family protein